MYKIKELEDKLDSKDQQIYKHTLLDYEKMIDGKTQAAIFEVVHSIMLRENTL